MNVQESNNLTNQSSYRYSGLIHRKSVGIVDTPDKKGFTVVYKKAKAVNKPAKATVRSTMKAGARRSLYKLKTLLTKNKYRVDLTKVCELIVAYWNNSILVLMLLMEYVLQAALRRASAVLQSQKPLPAKKTRTTKKAD